MGNFHWFTHGIFISRSILLGQLSIFDFFNFICPWAVLLLPKSKHRQPTQLLRPLLDMELRTIIVTTPYQLHGPEAPFIHIITTPYHQTRRSLCPRSWNPSPAQPCTCPQPNILDVWSATTESPSGKWNRQSP